MRHVNTVVRKATDPHNPELVWLLQYMVDVLGPRWTVQYFKTEAEALAEEAVIKERYKEAK